MNLSLLRKATEHDHAAVEASVNLLSASLTQEEYVATLVRMESIVRAWESLAETIAPPQMQPLVRTRNRHALIQRDLQDLLGDVPPSRTAVLPAFDCSSEFIGAFYVMEGSRLGGQFIARHVHDTLGLGGRGTAYFRGFGDKTGSMWKDVLQLVEREVPESDSEITIAAAKRMFHAFGSWMRSSSAAILSGTQVHSEVFENG